MGDTAPAGFTLVEIIVVLGMVALIASVGIVMNLDAYRNYIFSTERDTLVAILQKARSRALNNMYQSPHGVHIEDSTYTLFRGASFNSGASTNETVFANSAVAKTGINDIVFDQLSGNAAPAGDITLSNSIRSSTISVNNEGKIDW